MYQLFIISITNTKPPLYMRNYLYVLFFLSSPFSPILLPSSCLCPFFSITNTLTFMQNLGLVCLQSITLILEDDFNKQVTLSRGGQILTSPNHGFTLNGKKQRCACISINSKHNLKIFLFDDKTFTGCLCPSTNNTGGIIFTIFLKWPRVCTSKQILEIKWDRLKNLWRILRVWMRRSSPFNTGQRAFWIKRRFEAEKLLGWKAEIVLWREVRDKCMKLV